MALLPCPLRAAQDFKLPFARAGAACTFGSYQSPAIGFPLGATDVVGPQGDEVNRIYRVFASYSDAGGEGTEFAGWLMQSFDGRFAFMAAGHVMAGEELPLLRLMVNPGVDATALPVAQWLSSLAHHRGTTAGPNIKRLMNGRITSTALSPCFTVWDGKA